MESSFHEPKTVSLGEVELILRRRPGLILGPSVTAGTLYRKELLEYLDATLPTEFVGHADIADLFESLQHTPGLLGSIRDLAFLWLRERPSPYGLRTLVEVPWSGIVSLTSDLLFENELRSYFDSKASGWSVSMVSAPRQSPMPRTTPIYKLLGDCSDSRDEHVLALAPSQLLIRQLRWPQMLGTLADRLRDAPLILIGCEGELALLRQALTVIFSTRPPLPTSVLLLATDATRFDRTVRSIITRHAELYFINSDLKTLCEIVRDSRPEQMNLALSKGSVRKGLWQSLTQYAGFVAAVPPNKVEQPNLELYRQEILDALFRPASLDWRPFHLGLPLERTQLNDLLQSIAIAADDPVQRNHCIVLRGEAAVGKTTLLKTAAAQLSTKGYTVIWCLRAPSGGNFSYRSVADVLHKAIQLGELKNKPIVVVDDPWGLRISLKEIMVAFENEKVPAIFIVGAQKSDVAMHDSALLSIPVAPDDDIELRFELDDEEIESLPGFLVRVSAVASPEEAQSRINSLTTKQAGDILCSLWYLLPSTRTKIFGSLQEEYCRLGSAKELIRSAAGAITAQGEAARVAYECVAVASNLGLGVPLEVLVRAAGTSYAEWLELSRDGKPLWGLIYDEANADRETSDFFTRNEVVTDVLVNIVNGGFGHAGELRVLRKLVSACDVGSTPYRAFLVDVLVRCRSKLERIFSYEQGAELYDLAFQVFPMADRSLAHHYGIWIKNKARDPVAAYKQFERALETPDYPNAPAAEPQEFIHTSMAAATVAQIKRGDQSREVGLELVKHHLRQASTPSAFDPHTAYILADLLLALFDGRDDVSLESAAESVRTLERALQSIGPTARRTSRYVRDIEMLDDLKERFAQAVGGFSDLRDLAAREFDSRKSQTGFEIAARRALIDANRTQRGRDYNDVCQYINETETKIRSAGAEVALGLVAARIDVLVRWKLQKPNGVIDWQAIYTDLTRLIAVPAYQDDVLKLFYYAVCLYHLRRSTEGHARFERIRYLLGRGLNPNERRVFLLGKEGFPRRLQAEFRRAHMRSYVWIAELDADFEVRQYAPPKSLTHGSSVQCYLAFSLNGPVPVFDEPQHIDLLMP